MDKNDTLEAKELKEFFDGEEKDSFKKKVKIIHDKKHTKQFSIRIPSKIASVLNINPEEDCFEFEIIKPEDIRERPKLRGELKKKDDEKK